MQALQHLLTNPVFWLAATLSAYALAMWVYQKSGYCALATPLLTSSLLLIGLLLATGTSYRTYFEGASHIHFLLGPATVALAVPLYEQRMRLARLWLPLTCGLIAGATTAIVSAVLIARWIGASPELLVSLAPKSVTVPIAVALSEQLGGIASLSATLVVFTGIFGALVARPFLALLGERSEAVRGFAIGLSAHGMGTSAAFQMSRDTGAFSGLAMGLTGLLTAFLAPVILPWLIA